MLPPGIERLLKKFMSSVLGSEKAEERVSLPLSKNRDFQDKHRGERCFILATGPSIRNQDLSVLAGETCFAVSHFFLHEDIEKIAPLYHVLAPYHPPFSFDDLEKVFCGFRETYADDVIYFFGHRPYKYSIYNFLNKFPENSKKNTFHIDYTGSQQLDENNHLLKSSWDIARCPFQLRTVIYSAIQIAAYMGFKEIYLLGCDHDYLCDMNRVSNHHFYREEEGVSDVEHLSAFTTERWFEEYYFRWKQYRLMREYLNSIGCEIYNSTDGGLLDVFPRRSLEKVFLNNE